MAAARRGRFLLGVELALVARDDARVSYPSSHHPGSRAELWSSWYVDSSSANVTCFCFRRFLPPPPRVITPPSTIPTDSATMQCNGMNTHDAEHTTGSTGQEET